jgi:hypothetical protein
MLTVYTEQHKLHDTDGVIVEGRPLGSFEVPARAEAIVAAVREARLGPVVGPEDHGLAPILAMSSFCKTCTSPRRRTMTRRDR